MDWQQKNMRKIKHRKLSSQKGNVCITLFSLPQLATVVFGLEFYRPLPGILYSSNKKEWLKEKVVKAVEEVVRLLLLKKKRQQVLKEQKKGEKEEKKEVVKKLAERKVERSDVWPLNLIALDV
ncbi:uncharacterized protein LOC142329535 [Lycorma delicatula]|uniref:uncharacterized protein LOC142329535 n=1 Tax=Lycorma delicatula TaxID=130591 RepID=UPI003F5112D9